MLQYNRLRGLIVYLFTETLTKFQGSNSDTTTITVAVGDVFTAAPTGGDTFTIH